MPRLTISVSGPKLISLALHSVALAVLATGVAPRPEADSSLRPPRLVWLEPRAKTKTAPVRLPRAPRLWTPPPARRTLARSPSIVLPPPVPFVDPDPSPPARPAPPDAVSTAVPPAVPPTVRSAGFDTPALPSSAPANAAPRIHAGGFQAPTETSPAPTQAQAPAKLAAAGFDVVTAARSAGAPSGRVVAAGFGAADSGSGVGPVLQPARHVASAGFADITAAPAARGRPARALAPLTRALEILDKPNPAYTDEARRLQIEGDVLLEARFTAAGGVRVLRVLRGLGHGLDESAAAAARAIHFRPAERDGQAVDTVAQVRLSFQLAY